MTRGAAGQAWGHSTVPCAFTSTARRVLAACRRPGESALLKYIMPHRTATPSLAPCGRGRSGRRAGGEEGASAPAQARQPAARPGWSRSLKLQARRRCTGSARVHVSPLTARTPHALRRPASALPGHSRHSAISSSSPHRRPTRTVSPCRV